MAGLEVLYASAAPAITCAQDAFICFLHWEVVTHGYYALGVGDQPGPSDKKSELLPVEWNSNKDLYVLRYESKDGSRKLLVKAVTVENSMIINVLVSLRDMLASAGGSGHWDHLCAARLTVQIKSLKYL
ncbi:hypothetical protein GH733_010123 [Mirounga leonina]|nr:hypothetical protein GH733_010123 [Mirounga leonina]